MDTLHDLRHILKRLPAIRYDRMETLRSHEWGADVDLVLSRHQLVICLRSEFVQGHADLASNVLSHVVVEFGCQ